MNFFLATIENCGSSWLCEVLNNSITHTVLDEEADGRPPGFPYPFSPFPIDRFARPDYGEVHGLLRHHLSAEMPGVERLIPKRGLIVRDEKEVIQYSINSGKRTLAELSSVMFEVVCQQHFLRLWAQSDPGSRVFEFKELTTNLAALQEICQWLEIDYLPSKSDLPTVVDTLTFSSEIFQWNEEFDSLYDKIFSRVSEQP